MMDKIDRALSNLVWNNRHIDDLNKAIIVVLIRAKEKYVAQLEEELAEHQHELMVSQDRLDRIEQLKGELAWWKRNSAEHSEGRVIWRDKAKQLEAERNNLLGIFGDYDFVPTIEQCREIWNKQRSRIIQLEAELAEYKAEIERRDGALALKEKKS